VTKRQPESHQEPVVQRIRIRYARRGPVRFTSHRDFARAFERAVARAQVPVAFSHGFSPHPRISYVGAAPTGTASEAEYLEIALRRRVEPEWLRAALDAALPSGLDVLAAVEADGSGFAERVDASHWRVELSGVDPEALRQAVDAFRGAAEVPVERLTKQGRRTVDVRAAVVRITAGDCGAAEPNGPLAVQAVPSGVSAAQCAILDLVVRLVTPTVRPDDILSGLRVVAGLEPPVPARATRLAQGTLTEQGEIVDPLLAEHVQVVTGAPPAGTAA
jgi:radical SAM-linked protein